MKSVDDNAKGAVIERTEARYEPGLGLQVQARLGGEAVISIWQGAAKTIKNPQGKDHYELT